MVVAVRLGDRGRRSMGKLDVRFEDWILHAPSGGHGDANHRHDDSKHDCGSCWFGRQPIGSRSGRREGSIQPFGKLLRDVAQM